MHGVFTSAIGPLPDGRVYPQILAVGEKITCATLDNDNFSIDSYGSSGAAALVSGTAALLYQAVPSLTPLEVKALILHTAADVTAGDPNAGGYGFMCSLTAVQAAQAGEHSDFLLPAGQEARFSIAGVAGETLSATFVSGRNATNLDESNDVDLDLRSPAGLVVWSSNGAIQNVDQIEYTFGETGGFTLAARIKAAFGSTPTRVAQAGLNQTPTLATDPDVGQPGPIANFADPVQVLNDDSPMGHFYIKGVGLAQATSVRLGGQSVNFTYQAPGRIRVQVPAGFPTGVHLAEVLGPLGSSGVFVEVGVGLPKFGITPINFVSTVWWGLESNPGEPYFVVLSPSSSPTQLPGIVDLGIGNGGLLLFTVATGVLPTSGIASGQIGGGGALPLGTLLHFQAAVFDLTTFTLIPSGVSSTLNSTFS
ncbi:S8 family serine peptidase [Engelhardtia mirabilis]|uniref:Peptidase S8/S53 domain-containing protein n=1 Tax=Engelhardtia mirabilis TaxID=2528011 RepID=A0A518BLR8_9BACT|nr:hypothetical protein Pla133_30040 [Planctomycetes bacterium Pla133]QDV02241.1 hypothetical protein Pla86_30030 [Planctomycetes bacterium Pla86]